MQRENGPAGPGRSEPAGGAGGDAARGRRRRRNRPANQKQPQGTQPPAPAAPAGEARQGRKRGRNRKGNAPDALRQGNAAWPAGHKPGGAPRRSRRERADHEGTPSAARHAETWWADRWLATLHRFGWKGRLANGRIYAEEGRVTSFRIEAGRILAAVQGTDPRPYEVTIAVKPLPDSDWDLVADIMSCQALFTAQLLAGEMPLDVEEVFDAAQAPLFPHTKEDIQARCSCPDWANPCKHIAAVYYVMADAFDKDPFLIFHLRGRSRDALIAMVRAQRAAEAQSQPFAAESASGVGMEPWRFWQPGDELEGVAIAITPPPVAGATAKRLGRPPFWRSPADPVTRLADVYEAIARRAREVALNEAEPVRRPAPVHVEA